MPSPAAFLWALLYASSSAGEVLALRSLALLPLRLPALPGLLSNQMYLLLLPSYCTWPRCARLRRCPPPCR